MAITSEGIKGKGTIPGFGEKFAVAGGRRWGCDSEGGERERETCEEDAG